VENYLLKIISSSFKTFNHCRVTKRKSRLFKNVNNLKLLPKSTNKNIFGKTTAKLTQSNGKKNYFIVFYQTIDNILMEAL
jgi:hypothetical protein